MEPTNKMNKFTVAVIKSKKKIIRHLPLGKTGHFPKSIFYFWDANTMTAKLTSHMAKLLTQEMEWEWEFHAYYYFVGKLSL